MWWQETRDDMTPVGNQVGSQAVDRAAALLALVVESERPRSFASLVSELGLAKSTTSRLLGSLERNRLVLRDPAGGFRAGPLFTAYAVRHPVEDELVALARPALERLGELTGETVNLAVPRGPSVVPVAQVDASFLLGAVNWVGIDLPPHCSALGKVFYAFDAIPLPEGELERRTPQTLTSPDGLRRDLRAAARRGWALAWEELEPGLVAIAAPVRAGSGWRTATRNDVVAALSVSGPTARISRPQADRIAALVVTEARAISALLGHRTPARAEPASGPGKEGAA
jgi:DNA-binding IclR family transcriptional regulator